MCIAALLFVAGVAQRSTDDALLHTQPCPKAFQRHTHKQDEGTHTQHLTTPQGAQGDASSSGTPARSAGTPSRTPALTPASSWQQPGVVEPWEIDPDDLEFVMDKQGKPLRLGTGGCGDVRCVLDASTLLPVFVVLADVVYELGLINRMHRVCCPSWSRACRQMPMIYRFSPTHQPRVPPPHTLATRSYPVNPHHRCCAACVGACRTSPLRCSRTTQRGAPRGTCWCRRSRC